MPAISEITALRQKAIELLETALKITEYTGDEVSGYLIERALDQTWDDAWPNAIDDARFTLKADMTNEDWGR